MEPENNIPKVFYSNISEKPIENCIICGCSLLENDTQYVIEKAFKDGIVEAEYAMCIDCVENMKGSMSEESMQNIENYIIENRSNMQELLNEFYLSGMDSGLLLKQCAIKGTPVDDLKEYQIAGLFKGRMIDPQVPPYLISMEAAEEINNLLSKKTKDELDNFIDELTGLPPEWLEILKTNKPVLL